jgi:hypothetical protein
MKPLDTIKPRARTSLILLAAPALSAACMVGPASTEDPPVAGAEPVARSSAALNSGSGYTARQETAGDWGWHSTVAVNVRYDNPANPTGPQLTRLCTGVLVGWRHVATSGDCAGTLGGLTHRSIDIGFFWAGVNDDAFTPHRNVTRIFERNGTSEPFAPTPWVDSLGCDENVAILEMDGNSSWQPPAWLPGDSPSEGPVADSWVYALGLGPHDGVASTFGLLFEHYTHIRGEDWTGGSNFALAHLLTQESIDGSADNGGPIYGWATSAMSHVPVDPGNPVANEPMMLVGTFVGYNVDAGLGTHALYYANASGPHCAGRQFIHQATGEQVCAYAKASTGQVIDSFTSYSMSDCENVANMRRDATGWSWDTINCQILAGTVYLAGNPIGGAAGRKGGTAPWCPLPGGICSVGVDDSGVPPNCPGISAPPGPPPPPPCGGNGQACCTQGTACIANGTSCDATGHCSVPPSCGGANEVCCSGSTCPGSTNAQPITCLTQSQVCVECGNPGQQCCYLDGNPPYGCSGAYSCIDSGSGYVCQCDYSTYPNGCN